MRPWRGFGCFSVHAGSPDEAARSQGCLEDATVNAGISVPGEVLGKGFSIQEGGQGGTSVESLVPEPDIYKSVLTHPPHNSSRKPVFLDPATLLQIPAAETES